MKLRLLKFSLLLIVIVTSSGCLYRMDVQQGNRINSEMIAQLELGMSPRQVEFLLGEPAILDPYHPDTWHYIYYQRSGDDLSEQKRTMSLYFENNLLSSIEGDRDLGS